MKIIDKFGLKIDPVLFNFINNEAIPGSNIKPDEFWEKFSFVVHDLAPKNRKLIELREIIQKKINDTFHKRNVQLSSEIIENLGENLKENP